MFCLCSGNPLTHYPLAGPAPEPIHLAYNAKIMEEKKRGGESNLYVGVAME